MTNLSNPQEMAAAFLHPQEQKKTFTNQEDLLIECKQKLDHVDWAKIKTTDDIVTLIKKTLPPKQYSPKDEMALKKFATTITNNIQKTIQKNPQQASSTNYHAISGAYAVAIATASFCFSSPYIAGPISLQIFTYLFPPTSMSLLTLLQNPITNMSLYLARGNLYGSAFNHFGAALGAAIGAASSGVIHLITKRHQARNLVKKVFTDDDSELKLNEQELSVFKEKELCELFDKLSVSDKSKLAEQKTPPKPLMFDSLKNKTEETTYNMVEPDDVFLITKHHKPLLSTGAA